MGKTMERLPPIDETKLTAEQRSIYDQPMSRFDVIGGSCAVWLRSAELLIAEAANRVSYPRR
jgi:hypothetical protein